MPSIQCSRRVLSRVLIANPPSLESLPCWSVGLSLVRVSPSVKRPATDFDKIIVLNGGKVVGTGRHEWLMDERPEYARLYKAAHDASD